MNNDLLVSSVRDTKIVVKKVMDLSPVSQLVCVGSVVHDLEGKLIDSLSSSSYDVSFVIPSLLSCIKSIQRDLNHFYISLEGLKNE